MVDGLVVALEGSGHDRTLLSADLHRDGHGKLPRLGIFRHPALGQDHHRRDLILLRDSNLDGLD